MNFFVGAGCGILGKVSIRCHENFLCINGIGNPNNIGRGAANIGNSLYRSGRIDIGNNRYIAQCFFSGGKGNRVHHVGHGASGIGVGQEHGFVRGKNIGGFRHEKNPAEHDDIRRGF